LSTEAKIVLVGHILEPRPYAASQFTYPKTAMRLQLAWNNRLVGFLAGFRPVEKLKDRLDRFSDALYTNFCYKYVAQSKVDAIYSFPWPFDRYVAAWANRLSRPLVIEMWEDYACFSSILMAAIDLPRSIISREVRRTYHWMHDVTKAADRVIVPTQVFASRLIELGIESRKIRVVPVCVDPSPVTPDLQSLREKHSLNECTKVVFHIGGLSPWHDLYTLMRSIRYTKTKLVFVIAGRKDEKLEQAAADYARGRARVVFTGRIEPSEVGSYLSLADICVAPYKFPQASGFFPAKVIRYMLAGKPIIATDTPEIREMFRGREAGLLVPQENHLAWADALDRLAEDSHECRRLGTTAKEVAENHYLTRHHTQQLMQVFREVI